MHPRWALLAGRWGVCVARFHRGHFSLKGFQARASAGQHDHLAVEFVAADQVEFAEGALQQHLELGLEFTAR